MNIDEIILWTAPREYAIADFNVYWGSSSKQPENATELTLFMAKFFHLNRSGLNAYQEKLHEIPKLSLHDREIAEIIYQLEFLKQLQEKIQDENLRRLIRERANVIRVTEYKIKKKKLDVKPEIPADPSPAKEIPPPSKNTLKIVGSVLLGLLSIGILAAAITLLIVGSPVLAPALLIGLSTAGIIAGNMLMVLAFAIYTTTKDRLAKFNNAKTKSAQQGPVNELQTIEREKIQQDNQDLKTCYDHIDNLFEHIQGKSHPATALQEHQPDPIPGTRDVHAPLAALPKTAAPTPAIDPDALQKKLN